MNGLRGMSDPWKLGGGEDFCLTVSSGRSVEETIEIYGADRGKARWMSSAACYATLDPTQNNTILRAGTLGDWCFCIEFWNPIGYLDGVVRKLSTDAKVIILSHTGGSMTAFRYVVNGRLTESFEPNYPPSAWGHSEYNFARRVHELPKSPDGAMSCLRVIGETTGHELTREILQGPLFSVIVEGPDRTALSRRDPGLPPAPPPGRPRPLGRSLGSLRPRPYGDSYNGY